MMNKNEDLYTRLIVKTDGIELSGIDPITSITFNPFTSMEIVNQNTNEKKDIDIEGLISGLPNKVIFNNNATVLLYGNDKIILHKDKDDTYDPTYAFLYGYFLHTTGLSKNKAAKFLNELRSDNDKKASSVNEVLSDKSLSLDQYEIKCVKY